MEEPAEFVVTLQSEMPRPERNRGSKGSRGSRRERGSQANRQKEIGQGGDKTVAKARKQRQRQQASATAAVTPSASIVAATPNSDLLRRIAKQLEYYFSDKNLAQDKFLQKQLALDEEREGWLKLDLLASFAKIKALTTDITIVQQALRQKTKILALDEPNGVRVRRLSPLDPSYFDAAGDKPKKTAVEMLDRLEHLHTTVSALQLSKEESARARIDSPFHQIGSLKVFLRRYVTWSWLLQCDKLARNHTCVGMSCSTALTCCMLVLFCLQRCTTRDEWLPQASQSRGRVTT